MLGLGPLCCGDVRTEHRDRGADRGNSSRDRDRSTVDDNPPTSTLLIKGLSTRTTDQSIGTALARFGPLIDLRLPKDRETGLSRGIAFVDFPSVEAAQKAMKGLRGRLVIDNQEGKVEYSRDASKPVAAVAQQSSRPQAMDWLCERCNTVNFARRTHCFSCNVERSEDAVLVNAVLPSGSGGSRSWEASGTEEPCNVLIVRGVAAETTEATIRATFSHFATVGLVRLIHEHGTGQSRGFCFVDFASVADASRVLREAQGLVIDGQQVRMAYARPKDATPGSAARSGLGSLAVEQARAIASGQTYATPSNVPEGFVHDPRSGWYYHSTSGYYFDANTSLYYAPATQKYYRYDHTNQQYVEYEGAGIALFKQNEDWTDPSEADQKSKSAAAATAADPGN
mmetsp:Transcript_64680/g.173351  ORF Transcript_64680/g.173351 Transcript_64680/m.173351 type:complete len:397 (-) Transcript_64680:52-1242(-)